MNRVRLPGWEGPVLNAAVWLREHLDMPKYETLEPAFAEYFNCQIVREDDPVHQHIFKVYAEFDESAATLFILQWT